MSKLYEYKNICQNLYNILSMISWEKKHEYNINIRIIIFRPSIGRLKPRYIVKKTKQINKFRLFMAIIFFNDNNWSALKGMNLNKKIALYLRVYIIFKQASCINVERVYS